ncbi:MAG: diacylglucosamine hydrolase [Candidatus Magasanikbacteria bacterium CG10_big_fil_rev_8_21_14_0_10_36_32]|uniref:Epoxyqueuosine reductase QueH n=1 Tax=Candidatus Magasanikbacteria bacterium CG10_big_fil_rev_8_21_14_0_10_36_32 TaxID=1974646 RepID=A0A2M6W5P7_9BACT|nr:MAG: diacylglucosamine hydrolase [Candidatus Magasanikbacteria bacterium CG10_big_fil_rev_8_21_14_0_10_36_32]
MKKLLLHTCCAPCSIAIIDEMKNQFQLTVFFYNPNIFPEDEYLKRKAEVIKICQEWGVSMIDMDYETDKWNQSVIGLETEPESGVRCLTCFQFRLTRTAEYAKQNNFGYFATSLTMGRNKKAEVINPIGLALAEKLGVIFYAEDWKKNGRQEKGRQLTVEKKIYRQSYCGCLFSIK